MSVSAFPLPLAPVETDVAPAVGRRLGIVAAGPGREILARAVLAYARREARAGARVAVVEADGSRRCLSRLCGVPSTPGLGEVLSGLISLREALRRGKDGVACLPFGGEPIEPAASPGMSAILDRLAQDHDRVLVACPTLGPGAGSVDLPAGLDGVVLVVWAERTRRRIARRAVEALAAAGTPVVGTILHDCRPPLPDWIERWLP